MVRFLPSSRSGQLSSPMVAQSAGALMGWAIAGSLLLNTKARYEVRACSPAADWRMAVFSAFQA